MPAKNSLNLFCLTLSLTLSCTKLRVQNPSLSNSGDADGLTMTMSCPSIDTQQQ